MRRILCLLLALAAFACFSGCAAQPPASVLPGGTYSGGSPLAGGNLTTFTAHTTQLQTILTLSFATGSAQHSAVQKAAPHAPAYQVAVFADPPLLRLTFPGLAWWDADLTAPLAGLFVGALAQPSPAGLTVYCPLADSAWAQVSGRGERVGIAMQHSEGSPSAGYRAVRAYEPGEWPNGGWSPVILRDGSAALASPLYPSQAEAQAAALASGAAVLRQEPGQLLPALPAQQTAPPQTALLYTQSGEVQGSLLTDNGRYLCTAPDGRMLFARAREAGGGAVTETLQRLSANAQLQQLTPLELQSVLLAAWSPDGRYLALLEQGEFAEALYLYDETSGRMTCEAGVSAGWQTTSVAWGERHTLYSVTRWDEDEPFVLQRFDYDTPAEEAAPASDPGLPDPRAVFVSGGAVYALDGEEGLTLVADDLSGYAVQIPHAVSAAFSASGGRLAAHVLPPEDEDEGELYYLPAKGAPVLVPLSGSLLRLFFLGENLYALSFEEDPAGEADNALSLVAPDGRLTPVGRLRTAFVSPGGAGELIATDILRGGSRPVPVAYLLTLPE